MLIKHIQRLAVRQPARFFASQLDHHHDTLHKEEYLKVAREWPHEYFDPSNYDVGPEKPEVITPEMLSLIQTSHAEPEPETFGNRFWTRLLLTAVIGAGFYRINDYLTRDGNPHPFTTFIGSYLKDYDGTLVYDVEKQSIPIRQQHANDQLILQNRPFNRTPVGRFSFPDTFSRASDFLIPVGSQVDVSDIKMKHGWERDDELFGVPYPENE